MKTLTFINHLLSNGIDPANFVIVCNPLIIDVLTFAQYFGAKNANGAYAIHDKVRAGLAVYGEENFICGTPDAIFDLEQGGKLAWYDHQQ